MTATALTLAGAAPARAGNGGGDGGDGGGSIWAMTWWGGSPQGPGPYLGGVSLDGDVCIWQDAGSTLTGLDALLAGAGLPASFWTVPRGGGHHGIWGINLWAQGLLASGVATDHVDLVACPDAAEVPPSGPDVNGSFPTVTGATGRAMHLWLYFDVVPDPPSGVVPPLVGEAFADAHLPVPVISTSPSSIDGISDATLVNFPTWLWIEPSAWHEVVATAAGGGYVATVWAVPQQVSWSAGWSLPDPTDDPEGGVTLAPEQMAESCEGPGTAYDTARSPSSQASDCTATFAESTYGTDQQLTASIIWDVHWALSDTAGIVGGEGVLPNTTTMGERALRVLQVESVITSSS